MIKPISDFPCVFLLVIYLLLQQDNAADNRPYSTPPYIVGSGPMTKWLS